MPAIGEYVIVSGKRMRFAPTNGAEASTCSGCHFYKKHLASYDGSVMTEAGAKDNCYETGRATVCQGRGLVDTNNLVYVYPSHYKRYINAFVTRRILGE